MSFCMQEYRFVDADKMAREQVTKWQNTPPLIGFTKTPHSLSWVSFVITGVNLEGRYPVALRADRTSAHRVAFEKNRKRILKTENVCGICGRPVDKTLKAPDSMSAVIDHIIPINKGGHPSAMENLQLAHWHCNRQKSDKLFNSKQEEPKILGNRNLPKSCDWLNYKDKKNDEQLKN